MKKAQPTYSLQHVLSSLLMVTMLLWLTVCLPVVNGSQKSSKAQTEQNSPDNDGGGNPLTNTNEEKCENGTSLLAEYLHEVPVLDHLFVSVPVSYKPHLSDTYLAYHPDMVIPPPEV